VSWAPLSDSAHQEENVDTNAQHSAGDLSPSDQEALLDQLDRTLESAGIHLASEIRDGALILSGEAIEPEDHQAALDVAHAMVDSLGLVVEDAIEDMDEEAESTFRDSGGDEVVAYDQDAMRDAITSGADGPLEVDPDFTGDVGTTDSQLSAQEAVPYFPPTDPVVRTQDALGDVDDEAIAIVGGFAETAMDEDDDPATVYPSMDDDLAEAVMRELRQDAATADLSSTIRVSTRGGVVLLTGRVETMQDAEEAAAVADRVDGVVEVREELEVTLLPHPEEPGEPAGR
jgi:hypothetical protein